MGDLLQTLDAHLAAHHPELYAELDDGVSVRSWRSRELSAWFAWHNGQRRDSKRLTMGGLQFISISNARESQRILRWELATHPLHGLIVTFFSPRIWYSLPILVDQGRNGFFFDGLRNTLIYREHAEQDRSFASWSSFLEMLCIFFSRRYRSTNHEIEAMCDLIMKYTD
ncbi:MAG: hypothetical protein U0939_23305 [Pirellulales bacterium]